nr:MAG TPA: hypothetical protein [Caudoviricetes sp.]
MTDITEIIVATLAFFLALIESATAESAICFALLAISFNVSYFSSSAICLYTLYGNGGLVAIIGILKSIFITSHLLGVYHKKGVSTCLKKKKTFLNQLQRRFQICQSLTRDIFSVLVRQLPNIKILISQMILVRHRKKVHKGVNDVRLYRM